MGAVGGDLSGFPKKFLGETIRIALVALRTPALRDPRHHPLVHVRVQRLVQPGTLKPLLEHQMLATGDHANSLHESLAVGLDRKVAPTLRGLRDHRERSARGMDG